MGMIDMVRPVIIIKAVTRLIELDRGFEVLGLQVSKPTSVIRYSGCDNGACNVLNKL